METIEKANIPVKHVVVQCKIILKKIQIAVAKLRALTALNSIRERVLFF